MLRLCMVGIALRLLLPVLGMPFYLESVVLLAVLDCLLVLHCLHLNWQYLFAACLAASAAASLLYQFRGRVPVGTFALCCSLSSRTLSSAIGLQKKTRNPHPPPKYPKTCSWWILERFPNLSNSNDISRTNLQPFPI
eukprot:5008846-Amphidinium_carterae.1